MRPPRESCPACGQLLPGGVLATFLLVTVAGAAIGGVAGALLSMAASGGANLYYEQEMESGRFLVTVAGSRLVDAEKVLVDAGAMEAAPLEAPLDQTKHPRVESG